MLSVVSVAFAPLNVGEFVIELFSNNSPTLSHFQIGKLFVWYQGIKNDPGLPDFYFTYNLSHGYNLANGSSLQAGLLSW